MGRACKAASHSCCIGKGQSGWGGKGGTGSDAEVSHAHFRQLRGSHATTLAPGKLCVGAVGGLGAAAVGGPMLHSYVTLGPRKQMFSTRSLTKSS